jgi:hypothetical protein
MSVFGGIKGGKKGGRKQRGGGELMPYVLTPEDMILSTTPHPGIGNTASMQTTNGTFSKQVGGGYGFTNNAAALADVPSYAGSYFPVEKVCTAGNYGDGSRGGNNFVQSGMQSGGNTGCMNTGGMLRGGMLRGGMLRGGGRTYQQKGCSTGGRKRRKTKKTRKTKKNRKTKRRRGTKKLRGGLLF